MEKQTGIILLLTGITLLTIPSDVYSYPWDDPVLELNTKTDRINVNKTHEITVNVLSCDSVKSVPCLHKNRIPHTDIQIIIHEIRDTGELVYIEEFETQTNIMGYVSHPIHINSLYKSHAHYEIIIIGYHNDTSDIQRLTFWTQEKTY